MKTYLFMCCSQVVHLFIHVLNLCLGITPYYLHTCIVYARKSQKGSLSFLHKSPLALSLSDLKISKDSLANQSCS